MRDRLLFVVPFVVLALMLALRVYDPAPVQLARWLTFDAYQQLSPRTYDPAAPVRIVDIDDASLERIGQWPWPRTILAALVDRLGELGASAIVFDTTFAEPDRSSPEQVLPIWPATPEIEALRARLDHLPAHDALFTEAIARNPVVLGFVLIHAGSRLPAAKASFAIAGDDPSPFVPRFSGAVTNLAGLEAAALGNGAINATPEIDQVMRRVPLLLSASGTLFPSLAAEALRVAQSAQTDVVKSSGASGQTAFGEHTGINNVRIGDRVVPTDAQGRILVHYTPPVAERYIPAWEVMEPGYDPARIAGDIIFVGSSAPGLFDLRATPLAPAIPGVEVHAQIVEQILAGDFLHRPDFATAAELAYILLLGIALILLLRWAGAFWGLAVGGAVTVIVLGASWLAFAAGGWLLDPVFPSITVLFVFIAATVVQYLQTEAEKRQVRAAFSHYLSPAMVERLAEDPSRLKLGGEMRDMSILFCDIRGFTAIAEQLDAEEITSLINRFLTPMTEEIMAHQGTIDKYMGDNVMAFWNAPLDDPDHARHACATALAMQHRLRQLNQDLKEEAAAADRAFRPLAMGIGINTGTCCVGNLGSDQRFDYSVLGDEVNLASRLEGQCKTYGVDVIIGEHVRDAASDFSAVELDLIRVQGKAQPVRIYTLVDPDRLNGGQAFDDFSRLHDEVLTAYRQRDWAAARAHLDAAAAAGEAYGLAGVYALYRERCDRFALNPPTAGWDGVYDALSK